MTDRIKILLLVLMGSISMMGQTSDSIKVSLITCYPGSDVYELYGHTELRVQDGMDDNLFNYGMFNFNAPNFIYRFVKGETDYMLVAVDPIYLYRGYESRKMVEQVLNLTQAEAKKVRDFLYENALPQNATYRYNYVYNNCSTKPRDIIEKSVGSLYYPTMPDTLTFRQEMAKYNKNYPWQQFGIDLALGSGLDKTLTYREQMFVPMVLMNAFAGATIERDGKRVPLVKETVVINPGSDEGDIMPPTPWWRAPLAVSILVFLIISALTYRDIRRKKVTRWIDSMFYAIYGIGGCVIFFLLLFSTHEATSPNVNGWWLNPFCFIPAVLIWIKNAKKVLFCYHNVNFAIAIVLLMPFSGIANVAFYPLIASSALRSFNYIYIYLNAKKKAN